MKFGKSSGVPSDLAALDGKTLSLDKAMTMVSFVLLFFIVFIHSFSSSIILSFCGVFNC